VVLIATPPATMSCLAAMSSVVLVAVPFDPICWNPLAILVPVTVPPVTNCPPLPAMTVPIA
jgi:hypothetical protein